MNAGTDQLIRTWLDVEAQAAPVGLFERIRTATGSQRPRSPWFARLAGNHMRRTQAGQRTLVAPGNARFTLLALIALVLVVAAGVAVIGSGRPNHVVLPPTTSTTLTTPGMRPLESSNLNGADATPAPGSTRIPDALIGAWREEAEYEGFWWFLRAGDPFCTEVVHTNLDCTVTNTATSGFWRPGIAWLDRGELVVAWHTECSNPSGRYQMFATDGAPTEAPYVTGDFLYLRGESGFKGSGIGLGCRGGSFVLFRAGTGSMPTAPPKPIP
jgi:hypothetical protein